MLLRFLAKMDPNGEIRGFGYLIVFLALFIISYSVDYDPRTGWRLVDRPYFGNTVQVTKEQTLSMIRERKIKIYGVRCGKIVMSSERGKWFMLNDGDNHDVVMQLGQYAAYAPYCSYDDNDILFDLIPPLVQ